MSWSDEDADWEKPKAGNADLEDKWAGEDVDDDALLGDDWDAEPKKEEAGPTVAPGEKKLTKRQLAKKKEEEEKAAREAALAIKAKFKEDPTMMHADRLAMRKAIEESDHRLTEDLFGGEGFEAPEGETRNPQNIADNVDMIGNIETLATLDIKKKDALEDMELKTVEDFKNLGKKVGQLVAATGNTSKNQKNIIEFLKVAIEEATAKMNLDNTNEVKKAINVICTKKQKAEKKQPKKGGGASKKAQLTVGGKGSSAFDDLDDAMGGGDDYDDFL